MKVKHLDQKDAYIAQLEKALDKACEKLAATEGYTKEMWKELLMNEGK